LIVTNVLHVIQNRRTVETVEGEEGKAVEVVLKGYMLKNKLLRPAKVKVGQKQKEEN